MQRALVNSGLNGRRGGGRRFAGTLAMLVMLAPFGARGQPVEAVSTEVAAYALAFIGHPYRLRGTSPATGFDCSGFVQYVFASVAQLELPRIARDMARVGRKIERDRLEPGDLVFFNTRGSAFSHVGIYIGENRFVHAPRPGTAVSVVDMAHAYWRRKYNGARRVLSEAASAITPAERPARFSPAAEGFAGGGEAEPFPPQ